METIKGKKQSKMLIIGIAAVVLVVAVIVAGLTASSGSREYKNHLDMAQKYLEELDYEQAVVELRLAIEIEPNNSEAYFALADVYVAMEDYESALAVLEEGYAANGDEAFLTEKERIAGEYAELQEQQAEEKEREREQSVDGFYEKYAGLYNDFAWDEIEFVAREPYKRYLTFAEREVTYDEMAQQLEQYLTDLNEMEGLPEELSGGDFDSYNEYFTKRGAYRLLAGIYLCMGKLDECLRMRTEWASLCDRPDLVEDGNYGFFEQTSFVYDKYGRIIGEVEFGGLNTTYVYEEAHNGASHSTKTGPESQEEIEFTYDSEGRILHCHRVFNRDDGLRIIFDEDYSYTGNNSVVITYTYDYPDDYRDDFETTSQEERYYNEYGTEVYD